MADVLTAVKKENPPVWQKHRCHLCAGVEEGMVMRCIDLEWGYTPIFIIILQNLVKFFTNHKNHPTRCQL